VVNLMIENATVKKVKNKFKEESVT
jgi:hypothetical protein